MTSKMIVVAALAVFAAVVEGSLEPGLRVRFDVGTSPDDGTDYFFNIPRTVAQAAEEGWKRAHRPRSPKPHLPQLTLYCSTEKILCALYDDLKDVAGLQICPYNEFYWGDLSPYVLSIMLYFQIPESASNVSDSDWRKRGYQTWNTVLDDKCVNFWCTQQYFVSEEYLQKSKEERLELRDPTQVLQEKAVWLTGTDRELQKITNEAQILEEGLFTEQACIPWMGQHYYYNMSTSTECTDENLYTWFPMTMDGELVATGYSNFISLPVGSPDWFERPERENVEMIVPNGPECVYELAGSPGALTMHIYYTRTPWLIAC